MDKKTIMSKQFGGKVTKKLKDRYEKSPNWVDGKFMNLEETTMDISFLNMPKLLYRQVFDKAGREPKKDLPILPFDKEKFLEPSDEAKFIWYGHSVALMRINGLTILMDPMLGPNASPIAPFSTKRFSKRSLDLIGAFPEIDLMLMTHDHYDHLDLASISRLQHKVKKCFVAIGVGRHLEYWGWDANKIQEFDWWKNAKFENIEITFTPNRHFSGRGLTDRAKSLWGGWVFKTEKENIYWSGDGGYGKHFKEVGEKLGPFDIGFMECGQYNANWHLIHMYPEEAVQAAIDAGVKKAVAVHWAGFALAQHVWKDPITRFTEAAEGKLDVNTPQIGELFNTSDVITDKWWEEIE